MARPPAGKALNGSPSSRRAWVEINHSVGPAAGRRVALLAEGVGRNCAPVAIRLKASVALLAEGVGRNKLPAGSPRGVGVALLAEGVGRNNYTAANFVLNNRRPPRGGRG